MSARPRSRRPARLAGDDAEAGSAVVEFIAVTVLLLVPIVYLVLVLGRVQAASFAVEAAAREAGRAYTTAATPADGARGAVAAVDLALADQGFSAADGADALTLTCSSTPCLAPGSSVRVEVAVEVALPFVPSFVHSAVPLVIAVDAVQVAPVDAYRGAG
ncbi:pilus assembly protein [Pengzhenrongella sicca]|uniref:Pilus assembly protein n=1 Tax=Pengzhenrongella sicca TaxID=2819238 RepID=A0A8A4ZEF0_9MICO|nr:pilus assembly protein [Pengzhenrongella sicca]QTE30360.1 pilus assembly protein [Pengzhenrongella sicca]